MEHRRCGPLLPRPLVWEHRVVMAQTLGPLTAEFGRPESTKFTAPLVLVHGLWDEPGSWRRFTGFLSHRGWSCVAVGWPDRTRSASLAERETMLRQALDALADRPVVLGHGMGGLLALRTADASRAAIALAPIVPGSSTPVARAGTWLQRLRGASLSPGRTLASSYPAARHAEDPALLRALADGPAASTASGASTAKLALVVAGADDPVTRPESVRSFASAIGASTEVIAGAHALHIDDGWEVTAGLVHRWLVVSLGEDLLALYEEAWADRDP